jgi:peptidoglycan hydrolase CwlO-like protein
VLALAFILIPIHAMALTASELQRQKQYYQAQAEAAKAAAAKKAQEAAMVKTQISNLNGQISQAESAISQTNSQISDTTSKIADLESQIKVQEDNLAQEKEKMHKVINSWYMEGDGGGLFESMLSSNSISEVTTKEQYYESIRQEISGMIDEINKLKDQLKIQKEEQEARMSELNGLKDSQTQQQKSLQSNQIMKNRLLNDTTAAISDLQAQQKVAEQKIAEIQRNINALSSTKSWGTQIVSSGGGLPVPSYYQTGNYTILGNASDPRINVNNYGCLITSFAMIASYYGNSVTPTSIALNPANFDNEGYLRGGAPFGIGVYTSRVASWSEVDNELDNNRPVIASIYLPSVGAINQDGSSHFIVIKGKSGSKYLMNDPIGDGRGYDISQIRSIRIIRQY